VQKALRALGAHQRAIDALMDVIGSSEIAAGMEAAHLAIARTDQTRHVERTHLSPRLVAQASQKRLEPTPKLASPIQRSVSHGRPLEKPTTHEAQKN
jgi:hypothetical protein